MDRILEAELAVEQKSDQGVEGPGGTGGSGSSVSGGVSLLFLLMGWGGAGSRSALSPPPPPSLYNPLNTARDWKSSKQGLSNLPGGCGSILCPRSPDNPLAEPQASPR